MRYGSVCSGIEAATVAWEPLGWTAAWFSEIEPHCRSVLDHHYPNVKKYGDFTDERIWFRSEFEPVSLIVGGTPCQDFSIAGERAGLTAPRGNLTMEFIRLADRLKPEWIVWENVPGVLTLDKGRAFSSIIDAFAECGYFGAWRIIDTQFCRVDGFGRAIPQRRRRVFFVGNSVDWRRAATVLLEPESDIGNHPPHRQAEELHDNQAPADACCVDEVSKTLMASGIKYNCETETFVPVAFRSNARSGSTITAKNVSPTLATEAKVSVMAPFGVRRLMPIEWERLQGFPDGYTATTHKGRPMADLWRYRMLGNSMSVNVMRWIGQRIMKVEELT